MDSAQAQQPFTACMLICSLNFVYDVRHPRRSVCCAQVVEQGTHAQLIEQGGQYCSMWSRQQDYCSIPPSPSPGPGLATAAAAAARLPRDKSLGASPLPGEVSRGIKGPLKLLLRQPEDGDDPSAAEQQQQQQGDSPADSAAATAAGDDEEGPGLIDVDSLGELAAAGADDGGVNGRSSRSSGGGAAAAEDEEEGGVRRLVDSSASIRRYHMLRRAETGG